MDSLRAELKEQTINGNISHVACFLLAMQARGCQSLDDITEEYAMSFFTDEIGTAVLSRSYRRGTAEFFLSDLGVDNC